MARRPFRSRKESVAIHRTNFLAAICTLAVLSLVEPGVASHHFPEYRVRPADAYVNKVEKAGLIVAVEPMEDPKQQKAYFNSHLSSKGMLPVFIVVQNNSAMDTYLFDSSAVGLADVRRGGEFRLRGRHRVSPMSE